MYYIQRNPISDASFLAGSVAEPGPGETLWVPATVYAEGAEVIRPAPLSRVFRCAIARTVADTTPPENDANAWKDMRPTKRYLPFGPQMLADGRMVYQNLPLKSTTGDIVYVLKSRYPDAVAIFGAKGAEWVVELRDEPGGTLIETYEGRIKSPATGYYNYAYGQRSTTDRVMVSGMPIFPNAEVTIKITGTDPQERAVSQIELGKLRFIPGVDIGGVEAGALRSPRAFTRRTQGENGSTTVLIYSTSYDMSGTIALSGRQEDNALIQFRALIGKGVAYTPSLEPGFQQSLLFGILKTADTSRDVLTRSSVRFNIEGLPT